MQVLISNLLLGLLFGIIVGSVYYDQKGICIMLGAILGVLVTISIQLYRIQKVHLLNHKNQEQKEHGKDCTRN